MPAASYGISESSVSITRLSTSLRSSERLIVLVMSSSMRSLSTTDKPAVFWIVSGIPDQVSAPIAAQPFDYTCSAREAETAFVFGPQMRDFDPVFRELTADAKAPRDFIPISSLNYHPAQRRIGHERRGADRIGRLFVGVVVFARDYFAVGRTVPCRPTPAGLPGRGPRGRVSANRGQAIRLMAEKDVRDFFHQRGPISRSAV